MRRTLDQLAYALYIIRRPFDGFWNLKYDGRGGLAAALILVALLSFSFVFQRQATGFIFNYNEIDQLNVFQQLRYVLIPFVLFCVANWALTTLMDGEGKFSEIVVATAYATAPIALVSIPVTIVSNFITLEEGALLYLFNQLAYLWFCWLLLVGNMTVHQFSMAKTVVTMLLTFVGMGVILFIGLLFFNLIEQVASFAVTIYKEMKFRL